MPKPEIEFTHVSKLTSASLTPFDPPKSGNATIRVLSHDPETGDQTSILLHPPGSLWGAPVCLHEYWEEAYILEGRIYDETLQKWFEKGSFCCRPPWMKHGPYKADPEAGCEEICYWRYPRTTEKGSKILPTTMRRSSGLSTVSPRSEMEQLALQTQTMVQQVQQETKQSSELGEVTTTSPLSPKRQSRLAAYLGNVEKRSTAEVNGGRSVDASHQNLQSVDQPKGGNTQSPLSLSQQSRLAANLASEEKQPRVGEIDLKPTDEAQENARNIGRPQADRITSPLTPKRQSRLAAYLASEEKRPKSEETGEKTMSQSASPPSPSSTATPPRQSRLAAYRSGGWNP
jgi:hypothetical protein